VDELEQQPVPEAVSAPASSREPWATRGELIFAAQVIGALLLTGVLVGLLWRVWASTATRGLVYYHGAIVPDETEGFISSDGRFALLTTLVGLAAGVLVWLRRSRRGPVAVAALAFGAVAGAALTDLVGHLVGGGSTSGKVGTQLHRLPLEVHAIGLIFVEGAFALLVYVLCTQFAARDDLGVNPVDQPEQIAPIEVPSAP
jgi:hypothetical protein